MSSCSHAVVYAGLCAICGADVSKADIADASTYNGKQKMSLSLKPEAVGTPWRALDMLHTSYAH